MDRRSFSTLAAANIGHLGDNWNSPRLLNFSMAVQNQDLILLSGKTLKKTGLPLISQTVICSSIKAPLTHQLNQILKVRSLCNHIPNRVPFPLPLSFT